ncbi:MAG: 4Fe-4S binding protein [Lentisphaeria bacterium]|nr:4Fe-4S binding protein [Lentisphaeria bacterium]
MKRKIIHIDREKCNGCGQCVAACHEGAIRMSGGKAELVSDVYCDGLGACIGECPVGAITIEEREAEAFDAGAVARLAAAIRPGGGNGGGCPGLKAFAFGPAAPVPASRGEKPTFSAGSEESHLRQWPVQLHLVPVQASWWEGADVLLAADCVAVALPGFQERLVKGRRIALACPKLDDTSGYVDKLAAILAGNDVRSLTVARMQVPCCGGIVHLAQEAIRRSGKDVPMAVLVIDHRGAVAG